MGIDRGAKRKKFDSGRDSGGFVALPWSVLDCPAFSRLSHPARSLLMEFARQFTGKNNGRLLASASHLASRGWTSNDVITRGKRELLEAEFIVETRRGARPNKSAWYAVTWQGLDKIDGFDAGVLATFERGAYSKKQAEKINVLKPSHGIGRPLIAPSHGVETSPPTPSNGAIRSIFTPSSTPSHGDYLVEIPSAGDFESADPHNAHHQQTNSGQCENAADDVQLVDAMQDDLQTAGSESKQQPATPGARPGPSVQHASSSSRVSPDDNATARDQSSRYQQVVTAELTDQSASTADHSAKKFAQQQAGELANGPSNVGRISTSGSRASAKLVSTS